MAVQLNVNAQVRGQQAVAGLNRSVQALGRNATVAASRFGGLEAAAARGRTSLAGLSTALNVGVVAGFAAATFAAQRFVRGVFDAGNLVEASEVQFNAFFGDVAEGSRAFETLTRFAGRVPFSLQDIIRGGTPLAAISDNAVELGRNLQIVGNLAATANIDFATAALQYQRVASAGVASADLLRDRGITGLLGFVSGARVTADESIAVFEEAFGPGGRFGQLTDNLATTLTGQFSLIQDALFQFQSAIADRFFSQLTDQFRTLTADLQDASSETSMLADTIGDALATAFRRLDTGIRFVVENFGAISSAIQAFIAFRLSGVVLNIGAAVVQWGIALRGTTGFLIGINAALRANPIGAVITAVQLGTAAFFLFREEITYISERVVGFFNERIDALVDGVIGLVRQLNRLPGINIQLETSTERATRAANEQRLAIRALTSDAATQSEVFEGLAEQQNAVARARAAAEANQTELTESNVNTEAQAMARAELLRNSSEEIQSLLNRDRITGELTERQREILQIRRQILQHEIMSGEALSQTAEQIYAIRQANEANAAITNTNLNDLEGIVAQHEEILTIEQTRNRFLQERAAITRRAFQETVRMAEAEEAARVAEEGLSNRERGSLIGRDPQITQEQIEAIMNQEMAWEVVLETVDEIGETLANNIIDGIQEGTSAMEIFRDTARSALNQIARQLLSSGISDLLGRGVNAIGGRTPGGGGGFLNTIFGGARRVFGFQNGGIVPGGAPFTDRVPALLTPGERVIPRDQVNQPSGGNTNVTNINISGNVDQRAIEQIRSVIAGSSAEVGESNRTFSRNTRGLRPRRR